jgi:hypothetical protein
MGCWSMGVLERWVSVHHSSTPPLHYSNHLGWSEGIERNEAYESFFSSLLGPSVAMLRPLRPVVFEGLGTRALIDSTMRRLVGFMGV